MSGTVYLLDRELVQHGPLEWNEERPPQYIERLRPRLPSATEVQQLPDAAIPLDRVRFRCVVGCSAVRKEDGWSAVYYEETP